jgi:hypothetical protein
LQRIDHSFGRQALAEQEKEQEILRRNQDHCETIGADHSAASLRDQNLDRHFCPLIRLSLTSESEFCAAGGAREWDHVADIRDAGDEHQHSLEPESEP